MGLSTRLPKGVWIGVGIGVLAGVGILCMYFTACLWQSPDYMPGPVGSTGVPVVQGAAGERNIVVKVSKLLDDYDRDEKEADELYLGNMLQVDGAVASMRKIRGR